MEQLNLMAGGKQTLFGSVAVAQMAVELNETLLSEIAALKGEMSKTERDYSELRDSYDALVAKLAIDRFFATRLTQSERQRDELLSFVRKLDCECDPSFSTASCGRCVQLANQGAE